MILGVALIFVKFFKTEMLGNFSQNIALIIGIILLAVGFMLIIKKETHSKEVPIYEGKKVVGYRRHK